MPKTDLTIDALFLLLKESVNFVSVDKVERSYGLCACRGAWLFFCPQKGRLRCEKRLSRLLCVFTHPFYRVLGERPRCGTSAARFAQSKAYHALIGRVERQRGDIFRMPL